MLEAHETVATSTDKLTGAYLRVTFDVYSHCRDLMQQTPLKRNSAAAVVMELVNHINNVNTRAPLQLI